MVARWLAKRVFEPMDRDKSRNDKRRRVLRNSHPQGARSRTMAGMRRMQRPSPTESPLLFEVDPQPLEETLTALGGIPLVVQAFRSLGLPGSVQQHVAVKERERATTKPRSWRVS